MALCQGYLYHLGLRPVDRYKSIDIMLFNFFIMDVLHYFVMVLIENGSITPLTVWTKSWSLISV